MSEDISKLNLKCGLEIHQQLDTGKLFCNCPSIIREDTPDFSILRTLRASEGETGEIDAAAKSEQIKQKTFEYFGYHGTTCLVELDEEPPHNINQKALIATVQTAKLLGSHILQDVHVMRKTVVDGSNTSGFQRTALLAIGGKLHEENVRIQTICLEEDSAKIIDRKSAQDRYNLSRLGIPLIEIATEPDIKTPKQAQLAAAELGMLLRSTGKCKRGLGTIRQDVNVSIKGGARVEIKGAQDLRLLAQLVTNEALRQHGLLKVKKELEIRQIKEMLLAPAKDVSKIFQHTKSKLIQNALKNGVMMAIALPKMHGLLGFEIYNDVRLGKELSGYAKAFGFGGLIHSDENLKKYPITNEELASIKKTLDAKKDDAIVMILGDHNKINDFFAFSLIPRLEQLLHGVPMEVRKALPDATSEFLRPMPGAARMYPETDVKRINPPTNVDVPKPLKEQEETLAKEYNLPMQHAKAIIKEGLDFAALAKKFNRLDPSFIATTLLDAPKEIKKRHNVELDIDNNEDAINEILKKANNGDIPKDAIFQLFILVAQGKKLDYSKYKQADTKEVQKIVLEVIKNDPKAPVNALMGQAMAKLRGKASGKQVMDLIKKHHG